VPVHVRVTEAILALSVWVQDWDVGVNVRVMLSVAVSLSDSDTVALEGVAVAEKLSLGPVGVQEAVPEGALPVIDFENVNVAVCVHVWEGVFC